MMMPRPRKKKSESFISTITENLSKHLPSKTTKFDITVMLPQPCDNRCIILWMTWSMCRRKQWHTCLNLHQTLIITVCTTHNLHKMLSFCRSRSFMFDTIRICSIGHDVYHDWKNNKHDRLENNESKMLLERFLQRVASPPTPHQSSTSRYFRLLPHGCGQGKQGNGNPPRGIFTRSRKTICWCRWE